MSPARFWATFFRYLQCFKSIFTQYASSAESDKTNVCRWITQAKQTTGAVVQAPAEKKNEWSKPIPTFLWRNTRTRLDARSCEHFIIAPFSFAIPYALPPFTSCRVVRKEIAHTTHISRHQQLSAGSARWSGRTKPRRAVRIYLLIFTQLPVTCVASPSVWKGDRDVNTLCLPPLLGAFHFPWYSERK